MTPGSSRLIIHNAAIHTMDPGNPTSEPIARAMASERGRILSVGTDRETLAMTTPDSTVIDAGGKTVIPGFNDNHLHALGMGVFFQYPLLFGKSAEEIVDILKKHYAGIKPGKPIMGFAWDYTSCPNPRKEILDKAFPRNPVILRQYSGHAAWVNSLMLAKLRMHSHDSGIITGTVGIRSHKAELLRRVLTPGFHRELVKKALEVMVQNGITSVQDNTWQPFTPWLLARMRNKGQLPVRFSCWPYGPYTLLAKAMRFCPWDRDWVRPGPWKYITDGAFSPHTALLCEPYENEPDNHGIAVMKPDQISRIVMEAARNHRPMTFGPRQLAFHAIGDLAVKNIVDAVEKAAEKYPWIAKMRIRIEHAQIIRDEDIPRIAQLGICIAAQPTGLSQPDRDIAMFGAERSRRLYPFRSLLDAGVHLSFGSDVPGEIEYNPLVAITAACTRQGIHAAGSYDWGQAVSVQEAVAAYTTGSAYAEFMEHEKGTISAGKVADMVMLSQDIWNIPLEKIRETRVLLTVTGGRIVYQAPAS